MSELQRLKGLLPPENQSWVFVEASASIDPPLITLEEIGSDEVEIQIDLEEWLVLAEKMMSLKIELLLVKDAPNDRSKDVEVAHCQIPINRK